MIKRANDLLSALTRRWRPSGTVRQTHHTHTHIAHLNSFLYYSTEKGGLNGGDGLIQLRARGPSEEDYFEILSKFKLSFNLLAKLKGYIHDPNAPELVHFLFTPLAIIIEAAKNNRKFTRGQCMTRS